MTGNCPVSTLLLHARILSWGTREQAARISILLRSKASAAETSSLLGETRRIGHVDGKRLVNSLEISNPVESPNNFELILGYVLPQKCL